jgi:hypothetical protein
MVRRRDHSVSTFRKESRHVYIQRFAEKQDLQLLQGADKHLKKDWILYVAGKKYVASDIVTLLESRLDAAQETTLAKAAWHKVRAHEETLLQESAQAVAAFRQNMLAMFADSPDALADFGLTQRKAPRALTPAELVEKAAKAKATRAARHTMGSRQKKAIQGSVVSSNAVAPPVCALREESAKLTPKLRAYALGCGVL